MKTPLKKQMWYLWDKNTDEIVDASERYETYEEWGGSFEDMDSRRVASDKIGEFHVSTIFLPINHSCNNVTKDIHKGIWFETIVFDDSDSGKGKVLYCERYHSAEEARNAHQKLCAIIAIRLRKNAASR